MTVTCRVTVDAGATLEPRLLGLGMQAGPYEWFDLGDDDWHTMLTRLERLRPGLLRVMLRAWWYAKGFDERGEPVYDWSSPQLTRLYRLLDFARAHDIDVVTGEWDDPSAVGDRPPGDPLHHYGITATDPRWARLVGDFLHQLLDVRGYGNVRYYTLINEPNGDWSHCGDRPTWERAVSTLAAELDRRGLSGRISIVGPDTTGADHWVATTVDSLSSVIGEYEIHRYATACDLDGGAFEAQMAELRAYISDHDSAAKRFFIGEAGIARPGPDDSQPARTTFRYGVRMADYVVQALRAGLAGVIAWNLDDAMFVGGGYGALDLKGWGCWNIVGGRHGYPLSDRDLRPWGYAWAALSTAFPHGARSVAVPATGAPGLRVAAATDPTGERLSVAVVNTADEPRRVELTVDGLGTTSPLAEYRYFADDRPAGADGFPVPAATRTAPSGPVTVELPSAGLTVLTGIDGRS
ncbi:hypothetical protein [Jiangella mangrovi]|uniref:Beta-glucuronidase C-terminal domain-containing protein n=1 Tax=Jiangella mangrovi TaxID=1524084 RepID=A0A7W9GW37_9ACTN|nr:hypothetical protein [Jiangella mangrovi]MBB5791120.1 hypothetical protein [Jiangella mangrovi]